LIDKKWFEKLAKSMSEITKKSIAFLIAQCLYCTNQQILFVLSNRHLYTSISWKNSFHFMTQKYQNFRCRVKRTGPKSPTLPYIYIVFFSGFSFYFFAFCLIHLNNVRNIFHEKWKRIGKKYFLYVNNFIRIKI
jgi:hypothetical protein